MSYPAIPYRALPGNDERGSGPTTIEPIDVAVEIDPIDVAVDVSEIIDVAVEVI